MTEQGRAARYSDLFGSAEGGRADSFGSAEGGRADSFGSAEGGRADSFGSAEGGRADSFGDHRHHVSDCAYCPFCATVAVVRKTHPEVLEHLAVAARELITAAGILIEEAAHAVAPPPQQAPEASPQEPSNVRRIDAL